MQFQIQKRLVKLKGTTIEDMIEEVYDAFVEEEKRQKETGIYNIAEVDGMSGFIFSNRFGNLFKLQDINLAIKRISAHYNSEEIINAERERREPVLLPNFSCHHLRHTFCSRLCENDVNVKVIQELMGHADIETTLGIYAEVTDEKKKEVLEEISKEMRFFKI